MAENVPNAAPAQPAAPQAPQQPLSIEQRISAALTPESAPAPAQAPEPEPEHQGTLEVERQPEAEPEPQDFAPEELSEQIEPTDAQESQEAKEPSSDDNVVEIGDSIADLSEYLGVPVEDFYDVKIPVSVNSETRQLTLGALKDAYREQEKIAQEREQVTALRNQMEREQSEVVERARVDLLQSAQLLERQKAALMADFQSEDWNGLREEDPAAWAARRQEYTERQAIIERSRQEVEAEYSRFNEQRQVEQQQQISELAVVERRALLNAIPQWQDEAVYRREAKELRDYLVEAGFAGEEVDQTLDHRLIVIARKAKQFDQREQSVDATKKRVLKISKKTAQPGASSNRETSKSEQQRVLRTNLRKSGHVNDAAAIIRSRMG